MKSFRIGTDRVLSWRITNGGEAYSLTGKDISLKVSSPRHSFLVPPDELTISDNILTWRFLGKDQKHLGPYTLTYIENHGKEGMISFDKCDAFALVAYTCQEKGVSDDSLGITGIDLESELAAMGIILGPSADAPVISGSGEGSLLQDGCGNTASGKYASAFGLETSALGNASHAEGRSTVASGPDSHAEGNGSKATGKYSHAEGSMTEAKNYNAHAEGNTTVASGKNSHAEGYSTEASGDNSHAEGRFTIATNSAEHASGEYNESTNSTDPAEATSFSHGIGSDEARKNAFEIKKNGDTYLMIGGVLHFLTPLTDDDIAALFKEEYPSDRVFAPHLVNTDGSYWSWGEAGFTWEHFDNLQNGVYNDELGLKIAGAIYPFITMSDLVESDELGPYYRVYSSGEYIFGVTTENVHEAYVIGALSWG